MIKQSFSFCALTIATFLSVAPTVSASTALPDIPPEQIALDIERRLNETTGAVEYYAPTFDPFEAVDEVAGTVSLRSNTRTTGLDGHIVRGGALLDINFFYTTDSDDPYDVAGFESAVFFSGEDVNATYYNNRIIECSERIQDVVYEQDYYHGASFGLVGGLYRPFPVYRGHRFFGVQGLNYGWTFPIGFSSSSRFSSSSGLNRSSRGFNRSSRFSDRGRVISNSRNRRTDGNFRRNIDDRRRRASGSSRGSIRDGRSRLITNGSRSTALRTNTDGVSRDQSDNKRTAIRRQGLRTIKGQSAAPSQVRTSSETRSQQRSVSSRSRLPTRSIAASSARETIRPSQSPSTRQSTAGKQTVSSSIEQSSTSQQSQSRPRAQARSVDRSSSRSSQTRNRTRSNSSVRSGQRSQSKSSNRSSRGSVSRSTNRRFSSSNPSSRRKLNFFPQTSLFGVSGYRTHSVSVSHKCAREENLSLHISRDRLEAARRDGLTVFVIDRQGQDIPVYIPPNYIEGFTSTVYGQSQTYQQPPVYEEPPVYQAPPVYQDSAPFPDNSSSQPRIYGDPNGGVSQGGYPQNGGF